jgi:hypothetical protein
MRHDNRVVSGKQFPGEKGSVRRCVVVMQQPVYLSPKFGVKVSHIFKQSPQNVTVVCGSNCLAWQEKFFVNNPPWYHRKSWSCSWLFTCLAFFDLPWIEHAIQTSVYGSCFLPRKLIWSLPGPPSHFFPRLTPNEMHTRCSVVGSIAKSRQDTQLQTKGRKDQHDDSAAWNVTHWLPGYASTIIYGCTELLQLLYRRKHQSRKLWTPRRIHFGPQYSVPSFDPGILLAPLNKQQRNKFLTSALAGTQWSASRPGSFWFGKRVSERTVLYGCNS